MVIYLSGEVSEQAKLDEMTPRQIVAELDKYVVGQRAETFFAFTQRFLGLLAFDEVRRLSRQHVQQPQLALVGFMRLAPVRRDG